MPPPAPIQSGPPLPRGTVLAGELRLDALLGQGEAGAVYNAWDLQQQRACAVKVLRPELCALTAALLRLRHDNREIARLQHPHLQATELRTLPDGRVVLHHALWYGETLRQRLKKGPLDAAEISRLFGALCGALQAAHNQGVLHGDLKPENLLLGVPAGSLAEPEPTLRVLDFGMHHLRTADAGIGSHPLLGPLSYLAPEQVQQGAQALELRSDLFALGALLYECATGQPAFAATPRDADAAGPVPGGTTVLAKICLLPTPLPSQAGAPAQPDGGPRLPQRALRHLDTVVARACHKDPAERYPSPEALWTALAEALVSTAEPADAGAVPDLLLASGPRPPSEGEPPPRPAPVAAEGRSGPARARSHGNKSVGARAIELFKQLEVSSRHQRAEPSVEIRRAAAVEAALLLDRDRADAEADAAGAAWRDAAASPAPTPAPPAAGHGERGDGAPTPPRGADDAEAGTPRGLRPVTTPLGAPRPATSGSPTAPYFTVPSGRALSSQTAAPSQGGAPEQDPRVNESDRTVNTQPSLRPVRDTIPLRARGAADTTVQTADEASRRSADAEDDDLLAALRPPLWWRLMPVLLGLLLFVGLLLLTLRGR